MDAKFFSKNTFTAMVMKIKKKLIMNYEKLQLWKYKFQRFLYTAFLIEFYYVYLKEKLHTSHRNVWLHVKY